MAKLTKWAVFWRAFFLTAFFGQSVNAADENEQRIWRQAVESQAPEGFYLYLSLYPAGDFVDEAIQQLTALGAFATRGSTPGGFVGATMPRTPGVYP